MLKKGITISFGNVCENSYTMEKYGNPDVEGFDFKKMKRMEMILKERGLQTEFYTLNRYFEHEFPGSYILVIRNLFSHLEDEAQECFVSEEEVIENNVIKKVRWDKHEYSRYTKGVVNLQARYKLCFPNRMQETKINPDYENKRGTLYNMNRIIVLKTMHDYIDSLLRECCEQEIVLFAEGNYYYDLSKTYIGFHRDNERAFTIACRFGDPFPMYFALYNGSSRISDIMRINLNSGDVYIMSEYACGNKNKGKMYVKHAAGILKI